MTTVTKDDLIAWVEKDRPILIEFLRNFIRCESPNPPGDTRKAVKHILGFLDAQKLVYRLIAPNEVMPNIVATFDGGRPGRHLALNGHIDVFPVESDKGWTHGPWSGDLADGKIYGRGAADMKCGTTASIFTYAYLHRIRDQLKGKLTLVAVSDEETFGPWGARYLYEHHPEVFGDCCLNGEPSGISTLRFGEKGPLWIEFTVRTRGAHGAYTHMSKSANRVAAEVIGELETLTEIRPPELGNLESAIHSAASLLDREFGEGAAKIVRRVTVNPGLMHGGVKVNMVASECRFELDVRVPNGLTDKEILTRIDAIVAKRPEVSYKVFNYNPPAYSPPDTEMANLVRRNAKAISGIDPVPVISLGGTDARLWRYKDIPAIVYGPAPRGMGSFDEHVPVEEFIHVVKCHVLSAYDYLTA